uniref:Protein-disulfide isomerase n=1 Tax=Candidatus Kentrum sp. DK TaxID=2126562 RepID=A0A450SSE7_9GAMM|nr:MAG: Protein-disulfide isomerase [Candidatus Kentron sp. DK]
MRKTKTRSPNLLSTAFVSGICLILLSVLGTARASGIDRALFQLDSLDYMESELPPDAQMALYELDRQYYQKLQRIIDDVLFDRFIREEAEREKKTEEEIRAARLSVAEPEENNVRALYEMLKERIGKPYEAVRGELAAHLQQERIEEKRTALVAAYQDKKEFLMLLPRPTPPFVEIRTAGFPVKGNPKAKVTIVEFADYKCPHCKTASQALGRVAKRLKDKVNVVYMDYLVTRSPVSRLVAQGAVCADKQGKFWAYHDLAYQHQEELNEDSPVDLAEEVKLDRKKFKKCLKSEEAMAKVKQAEQEAERLGVRATPSIFVNGKRVVLHDIEQDLIAAVEKALK